MSERTLEDIDNELEEAVARLGGGSLQGEEFYDLVESLAIQILDSEFHAFRKGELENHLKAYLERLKSRHL